MKERITEILKEIRDDADFFIYKFSEKGTFRTSSELKPFVEAELNKVSEVYIHEEFSDIIMLGGTNIGISILDFFKNVDYVTPDTEGFMEHISKYNKYYKVYIKLDKDAKTITFKLGTKCKTLELIEEGWEGYVSRPYRRKYLKCVSADDLEKHIQDEFWNPRMVKIGRNILGFKTAL